MLQSPQSLTVRFWQETGILTLAILGFWSILLFSYVLSGAWPTFLLSVLAGTSGVLLAMSFSLSSFSYYFDFLDSKLVYRKYLGLMGYFFAVGYALLVAYFFPAVYWYSFPSNLLTINVGLAALAMAIFTVMALISNQKAITLLGGKLWKDILGLGYVAYALLVIRAIFLDASAWSVWLADMSAPFSVRMFLTLLGTLVLLFRASVPFHRKYAIMK